EEEDGARGRIVAHGAGDGEEHGRAGGVVGETVVDRVAGLVGGADAEVVEMRRIGDDLIPAFRVGPGDQPGDVGGVDFVDGDADRCVNIDSEGDRLEGRAPVEVAGREVGAGEDGCGEAGSGDQ